MVRRDFVKMTHRLFPRAIWDREVILGALTANSLSLALPLGTLVLFDAVVSTGSMQSLYALALGIALALVLEVVTRAALGDILSRKGAMFERRANAILIRRLFDDSAAAGPEEAGVHIERAESAARLREMRYGDAATTLLDAPYAVVFVGFLWILSPLIATVVIGMATLALVLSRVHRIGLEKLQAQNSEHASRRYSFIVESLSNIESVKSMNLEDLMKRRYDRLLRVSAALSAEETARVQAAQGAAGAVAQAAPLVVAAVGAVEVISNQLGAGAFAAAILLSGRVLQPVLKLDAALVAGPDARRRERLLKDLAAQQTPMGHRPSPPLLQSLRLERASVGDRNGATVLRNVNLSIRRGECIAVSGSSGSGKSLLLKMLMGWVRPTEGELLINGTPAEDWDTEQLRERIAYMPSQPRLIAGTVMDNMTRFQPRVYAGAAMRIANELGIDGYFAQHPVGMSLPCGSGAIHGLPRSVEQRVPLVGALVADPEVILFDEANGMLDHEGDRLVLDALKRRRAHTAIVLITHRPAYLEMADRCYRIEDGRLVDSASSGAIRRRGALA